MKPLFSTLFLVGAVGALGMLETASCSSGAQHEASGAVGSSSGSVGGASAGKSSAASGAAGSPSGAGGGGSDGGDAGPSFPVVGSVTTVENLGAFPASRAVKGLGWQVTLGAEWEFKAGHDAGASRVRTQCSWEGTELQSATNTSNGFALPANCQSSLTFAKKYGLEVTFVGAFGPTFRELLAVTTTSDAAMGATTVDITLSGTGSLSSMVVPYVYLLSSAGPLSARHSYEGTLIQAVYVTDPQHATLTLASALTAPLPASTALQVEQILYPAASTFTANDPSVQAYARYVQFLGSQCAAAGVTCDIELWNEPPWGGDCWDNASDCYDTVPTGSSEVHNEANFGFVAALQSTTPPAGVTYTWAGTNKSGSASVLSPNMLKLSGVAYVQGSKAVTYETLHPYGNNPEDATWNQPCLVAAAAGKTSGMLCNTISTSPSNAWEVEYWTLQARETNPSNGIGHGISETGTSTLVSDETHKARFVARQYLAYLAGGLDYLEFYRLYDPGAPTGTTGFGYVEPTTGLGYTTTPAYTTLAGLVADAAVIGGAPVATYAADGTGGVTVMAYSGTFPLDIVQLVGSRAGDTASSVLVSVYQRSSVTTTCSTSDLSGCWTQSAPPASTAVTLAIPAGLTVASVVDTITRLKVPSAQVGAALTFEVSDTPIDVLLVP